MCVIPADGLLANELMVLEPRKDGVPMFPGITGATEHCTQYNNAPATLQVLSVANGFDIQDQTTNPPTFVQHVDSNSDAQTARNIALAYSHRCWIGGGNSFSTLDSGSVATKAPPYPVLEYWRK